MAGVVFGLLVWRPRWFRTFYRGVVIFGSVTSQTIAGIVLTLCFVGLVTPLGWMLRVFGKDLLPLRRRAGRETYWREADVNRDLNRQF